MANATGLCGPVSVAAQVLYTSSSDQLHQLGLLVHSNDGRVFRYAKAGGTTLVRGNLQQASAEDTSNFQNLTATNVAAAATSVTTTSTVTLTANQLAGGFLVTVSATTGAGQVARIAGHAAATAAVVTINLDDPLVLATTGTLKIDMIPNPYSAVVVNPTTATSAPVGVCIHPITNAQFGWLQVRGAGPVLLDAGTGVVGTEQVASNATAGAVEPLTGVQAIVGTLLTGIAATDIGFCMLKLA